MLKKIQVKCPSDEACSWEGCYGDAMAHLTNRNYHPSVLACQLVIPKKHRTPKFIRLSGAATEIVNGIYKPTDFFDDRQRFDKDTMVDGSQRRISIVWCKHGVGAWYISILDVERPGTNKDYDIYFSEEEKQGRFPPIGGWRLAENGVVPWYVRLEYAVVSIAIITHCLAFSLTGQPHFRISVRRLNPPFHLVNY